jgi:hypothetical protein
VVNATRKFGRTILYGQLMDDKVFNLRILTLMTYSCIACQLSGLVEDSRSAAVTMLTVSCACQVTIRVMDLVLHG